MNNTIKMGMVGGGKDAFIGQIHRYAARLDGNVELVCGAFSSQKQRAVHSGEALGLPAHRCYESYQQMFEAESQLPEKDRMDFVVIVAPNDLHFPVSKMAIEYGFHVLCDKPATLTLQEAQHLQALLKKHKVLYALSQTYLGYPMIKEAKNRVIQGELGKIKKVFVEYVQGWLAEEDENNKQAQWRLSPERAGVSCCMGDIGVHAATLAEYIVCDEIDQVCSSLHSVVSSRVLDDDGAALLRFRNGATGTLVASQVCVGEENNLSIRVYGTNASLSWSQQSPGSLIMKYAHQPTKIIRNNHDHVCDQVTPFMRTPAGHPQGYIEAFANIYQSFVAQLKAIKTSSSSSIEASPGIHTALRGMAFIETIVLASKSEQKWHTVQ